MRDLIGRLLEEANMTAYQLCKDANVPFSSLSLILAGRRKPSFDTMWRILQAADLPWSWLDKNLGAADLSSNQRKRKDEPK